MQNRPTSQIQQKRRIRGSQSRDGWNIRIRNMNSIERRQNGDHHFKDFLSKFVDCRPIWWFAKPKTDLAQKLWWQTENNTFQTKINMLERKVNEITADKLKVEKEMSVLRFYVWWTQWILCFMKFMMNFMFDKNQSILCFVEDSYLCWNSINFMF